MIADMTSKAEIHSNRSHPKLLPLKYSRDFPLTPEWTKRYFDEYFWKDLKLAYHIDGVDDSQYEMLVIFKDNKVGEMPITWQGFNHFHLFSQGVFFMSLCQQVLGKLYTWDAMEWFIATTGIPEVSCFMAGLRHPIYIIKYAELFHLEGFEEAYCKLLDLSLQYHIEIMSKILVDQDINIDDVIKEMTFQVEIFKRWVNDPNTEYPYIYATEPGQQ